MLSQEWFASLRDRSTRDKERLFLAEGLRFLHSALENDADIVGLAVCPALVPHPSDRRRLHRLPLPQIQLEPDEFRLLSRSQEPQGVLMACRQRWHRLMDIRADRREVHLVLDEPRSSGNLGTILRTCEAFGVGSLWLIGGEADPYDPKCVRASMGAVFSQRLVRTSCRAIEGWNRRHPCSFIGASPTAPKDIRKLSCRGPVALVMGNERSGLRPSQAALCHESVRIPMAGLTDSLNLAVATSIALFELFRERHPIDVACSYPRVPR